jgi:ankyrin repeat protein
VKEIEQADDNGDTAFLLAVLHGHVAVARALHAAGANASATRADGSTALHIASSSASASAAASISASLSASASLPSPVIGGNINMFAALVESGAHTLLGSKNASGDNVYHTIARSKNVQLLLLAANATKDSIHVIAGNARGKSPLMLALEGGGGADGAALAMELVNISGSFASGASQVAPLDFDT